MDNAAFLYYDKELGRLLTEVVIEISDQNRYGTVIDLNGNTVGSWEITGLDEEQECHECGREWTRSDGRGCPYGDPNCFLCEKHDHSDCDE